MHARRLTHDGFCPGLAPRTREPEAARAATRTRWGGGEVPAIAACRNPCTLQN
jgi:hypothetical protein